ncbi:MAG TPA: hypothetical protein VFV52_14785 [Bacilli bacterium]|nr:hypothetical protein [Bacilli bacterium]
MSDRKNLSEKTNSTSSRPNPLDSKEFKAMMDKARATGTIRVQHKVSGSVREKILERSY